MKILEVLKSSHFWKYVRVSSTIVVNERDCGDGSSRRNHRLALGLMTFILFYYPQSHKRALVPQLPKPSGSYQVGTTAYYLVDASRQETYRSDVFDAGTQRRIKTPPPTDRRELMVYVWYPAQTSPAAKPAPYLDGGFATVTADFFGPAFGVKPDVFIKVLTQSVQTHAFANAALASTQARSPVVLFSPGFGSSPKLYSSYLEQLASHGYVVVAVNPSHEAPVMFPDGRVLTQSEVFDFKSSDKPREQSTFDQATTIRAQDSSLCAE